MHAGERPARRRLLRAAAGLGCAAFLARARAIDNPDAPDRAAAFLGRAEPFEQALAATTGGSAASRAGQAYAQFLDAELNTAYKALLANLRGPAREALVESQRRWLRYRDAENAFIAQHWTMERSGTSATLSVQDYRNAVVKERVLTLLRYGAEYR